MKKQSENQEFNSQLNRFKGKILVVDDEPHQCQIMQEIISSLGYWVMTCQSPISALEELERDQYDIVISDLQMPELSGLELVDKIKKSNPTVNVVVVTAHGTIDSAVEAMKRGASDYILKPIEFESLEIVLNRICQLRTLIMENQQLLTQNEQLRKDLGLKYHIANAIGTSSAAKEMLKSIEKLASSPDPMLIIGEPGTGKVDIARMIHYNSARSASPIFYFDCSAVPEDLQEIQLFGVEKLIKDGIKSSGQAGLVEKAHMGTLVLINVHLLNRKCQSRLTTVLHWKKSQRIDGKNFYFTNIRLIAITSTAEYDAWINARWDLTQLISQQSLTIPPLRDRQEDIPLLASAILKQLNQKYARSIEKIDPDLLEFLLKKKFTGNFDELQFLIEKAVANCPDPVLKIIHLLPKGGA